MKEASGELSMTAIAVVAIAAIGVVFTTMVWPAIQNGIRRQTYCSAAFGCTCPPTGRWCDCFFVPSDQADAVAGATRAIQCARGDVAGD